MNLRVQRVAMLASALIVLAALGIVAMTSPRAEGQAALAPSFQWPPHPTDIMDIVGTLPATTAVGQSVVVLTVPTNRWLVVTDASWASESSFGPYWDVIERTGAGVVTKFPFRAISGGVPYAPSAHMTIGKVFQPGSTVEFLNKQVLTAPGETVYSLTGYYMS